MRLLTQPVRRTASKRRRTKLSMPKCRHPVCGATMQQLGTSTANGRNQGFKNSRNESNGTAGRGAVDGSGILYWKSLARKNSSIGTKMDSSWSVRIYCRAKASRTIGGSASQRQRHAAPPSPSCSSSTRSSMHEIRRSLSCRSIQTELIIYVGFDLLWGGVLVGIPCVDRHHPYHTSILRKATSSARARPRNASRVLRDGVSWQERNMLEACETVSSTQTSFGRGAC